MKTTITALCVLVSTVLAAQAVQYENLTSFDKLIVSGDVGLIKVERHHGERPRVKIEGVDKDNITTRLEAGIFYLDLANAKASEIVVYNSNLHRIETDEEVTIAGAEIVGSNGKYLIADFRHDHGPLANHVDIDLPGIEIDLPHIDIDIPEVEFDFDHHFDHDFDVDVDWDEDNWHFSWNWDEHKEEIKNISREVKIEVKKAMEEVKREIKKKRE